MDLKTYGNDHIEVATIYNNIAGVYQDQEKLDEALEWYFKDLLISVKALGTEHAGVAATYYNIGTVFMHQKDFNKALDWICRAVVVLSVCELNSHPHMDLFSKALYLCFQNSDIKDIDFNSWYTERVETYPSWCVESNLEKEQHG